MDAAVPLATIQRWLGHHNISQTSTYLAASGGGDADAMRAFEERTGDCRMLPYRADRPNRNERIRAVSVSKYPIKARSCIN
jgi:hypothetical protein